MSGINKSTIPLLDCELLLLLLTYCLSYRGRVGSKINLVEKRWSARLVTQPLSSYLRLNGARSIEQRCLLYHSGYVRRPYITCTRTRRRLCSRTILLTGNLHLELSCAHRHSSIVMSCHLYRIWSTEVEAGLLYETTTELCRSTHNPARRWIAWKA